MAIALIVITVAIIWALSSLYLYLEIGHYVSKAQKYEWEIRLISALLAPPVLFIIFIKNWIVRICSWIKRKCQREHVEIAEMYFAGDSKARAKFQLPLVFKVDMMSETQDLVYFYCLRNSDKEGTLEWCTQETIRLGDEIYSLEGLPELRSIYTVFKIKKQLSDNLGFWL